MDIPSLLPTPLYPLCPGYEPEVRESRWQQCPRRLDFVLHHAAWAPNAHPPVTNDLTRPTVTQSAGSRVSFSLWKSKNDGFTLQDDNLWGWVKMSSFFIETAGSEDKNRLSGHAGPVVFILKAMRINLIHVS